MPAAPAATAETMMLPDWASKYPNTRQTLAASRVAAHSAQNQPATP
jgi:hypothetical protein